MQSLRTLKAYFVPYKKKLFAGIVFILLSNCCAVYVPLVIRDAVDVIAGESKPHSVRYYVAAIVVLSLLSAVFRFYIRQTIIVMSRELEFDLRQDLWEHIIRLPNRFFRDASTGNIMAHLTNDIHAVRMFLGPVIMYTIDNGTKFVMIVAILMNINVNLTLLALCPLPILSYGVFAFGQRINRQFTAIQETFADLTTMTQQYISGIRVVKSYCREEYVNSKFRDLSEDYLKRNLGMIRIQALYRPLLYFITGLSLVAVTWVGGSKVIEGTLTIGEFTAYIVYVGSLAWPMIAFGWVINIMQQSEASMTRLNRIRAEPREVTSDDETDDSITNIDGQIEFRNVSFRYSDDAPDVLKGISLEINKHSSVAIVGRTGSGKSTLVSLIPRLNDCTGGQIKIDGMPLEKIPIAVLRSHIGFTPHDAFLFSDTISNNIRYGSAVNDLMPTEWAAELSELAKDIERFPKGYETILGERGVSLSGGQKQRTALARAFFIKPSVLILDDAISAVDAETEKEIFSGLQSLFGSCTLILITHRVTRLHKMDQIFVLENGRLVESGNHDQLLDNNGPFAELYRKQLIEDELEEIE